jgi:class 3 adenylate cyclase
VSDIGPGEGDQEAKGGTHVPAIRTFLIADVRGYTRFTQEHGDEEAGRLAAAFAELARELVLSCGGEVIELRGDEALCVFVSARQALYGAVELQRGFRRQTGRPSHCRSESVSTPVRRCRSRAGTAAAR